MAGIAEQRRAADRPARQRIAVEQGPDEAGLGGGDDPADLRMPAGKGGERTIDCRAVGPVLAVPGVVLGPADEIQQVARATRNNARNGRPDRPMTGCCDRGQDRRCARSGQARDRRHSRRTPVPRCRTAEPELSNGCHRRRPARRPRCARRCRTRPRHCLRVGEAGEPVVRDECARSEVRTRSPPTDRDDETSVAAHRRVARTAG